MQGNDSLLSNMVRSGETVFVDFWANWCSPCRQLSPLIDKISMNMRGRCSVVKMDIDSTSFHRNLGIQSVPTLVLFKDGKIVWRHDGLISETALTNALSRFC